MASTAAAPAPAPVQLESAQASRAKLQALTAESYGVDTEIISRVLADTLGSFGVKRDQLVATRALAIDLGTAKHEDPITISAYWSFDNYFESLASSDASYLGARHTFRAALRELEDAFRTSEAQSVKVEGTIERCPEDSYCGPRITASVKVDVTY